MEADRGEAIVDLFGILDAIVPRLRCERLYPPRLDECCLRATTRPG